jgi:DNA helicase-2/ATP-dependent DNA helicase PcrA
VQLRRNYRSGRAIVQGALQAIAPSSLVHGRWLDPLKADNNRITIHESPTDKAEAEFVVHTIEKLIGGHGFFSLDSGRVEGSEARSDYSFSDFAVLYRSDAQADVLCEALARSGIPFQRHSHEPLIDAPGLQAILQAMRTSGPDQSVRERFLGACRSPRQAAPASSPEVKRELPPVASYEGERFLAGLEPLAARCGHDLVRFESELALLAEADLWDPRADRVALLTLHASKGLEFAAVFITGCEDGLLPLRFAADDGVNLDEERRLFFVGMTRARERLFITHASKRLWRGQLRQQAVSPFVAAIEKELLERSVAELRRREKPAGEQLNLFG